MLQTYVTTFQNLNFGGGYALSLLMTLATAVLSMAPWLALPPVAGGDLMATRFGRVLTSSGTSARMAGAVNRAAAGRGGRALSTRTARLLGRAAALAVILLWSLFPIYWALNTSLTPLSAADSTRTHYFPSPFSGASYRAVFGIGGAGNGVASQLGHSLLNSAIESGGSMVLTVVIAVFAAYAFARLEFSLSGRSSSACSPHCCCPRMPP